MNCIVTDIDGTICEKRTIGNYEYGHGSVLDKWETSITERPPRPIAPMRTILQAAANGGLWVLYATARRELLREQTHKQLIADAFPTPAKIYMRPDGIRLAQDVLKVRYLEEMRAAGWEPAVWFEDDPNTVDALRSKGVHAILCQ